MPGTTRQSKTGKRRQSSPDDFLVRMGLAPNCTENDVRTAYLRLAKTAHPDHGGDAQDFQQLRVDYESALSYSRRHKSPRVHSFFLNPRNPSLDRKQRRQAITVLGSSAVILAVVCCLTFIATQSMVLPSLLIGAVVAGAYISLAAGFHPLVSTINCVLVFLAFTLVLGTLIRDQFFTRVFDRYGPGDFSPAEQIQLGLLVVIGLFIPLSVLSWMAAMTDRWSS